MSNLHDGHRARLKEQFLKNGIESFQTHQILELILFYARPRVDTNEIAHELLNRFGSLTAVLEAPVEELAEVSGMSESSAVLLKLIPELMKVYSAESIVTETMDNISTICRFFRHQYLSVNDEQIKVCCLDDNLRVISCSTVLSGSPDSVPVNARKIAETAYRAGCSLIILSHNHPNGVAMPSDEDIFATHKLERVLGEVGVTLLDHIIVGKDNSVISMKSCGYFNLI